MALVCFCADDDNDVMSNVLVIFTSHHDSQRVNYSTDVRLVWPMNIRIL